jgi:hypothetical protein
MTIVHVLRPGETIVMVADLYGFGAWETLAEAAENKALLELRGSAHALEAGDALHVPDPKLGQKTYPTGAEHRIVVRTGGPVLEVRVFTEFRRVPDGVAAGVKTGTICGWKRGGSVPPLPVQRAVLRVTPGDHRDATTNKRGVARLDALPDGEWSLRLDPQPDEFSPGPASPIRLRDHGLDWGGGNVPRSEAGRAGRLYEVEYRPLDLAVIVLDGAISSVRITSPRPDDRPFHAVCFWREGMAPGGKGVSQVLEIDWKPDFLRRLLGDGGVRPLARLRDWRTASPEDPIQRHPELFEIHHTGGNVISGAIAQFTSTSSKSGIHFLNDRDGHVVRMADDHHDVRHGAGQKGSVVCAWDDRADINARALGVENVQGRNAKGDDTEQPFTDAQLRSVVGLVAAARATWDIPAWRVIGHGDVYTGKASGCPGPEFPWSMLETVGLVTQPLALGDDDVARMFGGYFSGAEGLARRLMLGDRDEPEPAGTWCVRRAGRVIARGLTAPAVLNLNKCLRWLGYVPLRAGRAPRAWDASDASARAFGIGTKAAVQCFKGHYGAFDRAWLSPEPHVDFETAKLVRGCYLHACATSRGHEESPAE